MTGNKYHRGQFKTPSLRSVALTPPYMHDGSISSLWPVIEFYNQGGIDNPYLDPAMKPLQLTTDEIVHLIEFLKALNGSANYRQTPSNSSQATINP